MNQDTKGLFSKGGGDNGNGRDNGPPPPYSGPPPPYQQQQPPPPHAIPAFGYYPAPNIYPNISSSMSQPPPPYDRNVPIAAANVAPYGMPMYGQSIPMHHGGIVPVTAAPQQFYYPYYPQYHGGAVYPMMVPPPLPPNVAVVMPDGFDAQARFDHITPPSIPPPPPGVAPNMAQAAMMYGQSNQVSIGQKKQGFF